MNVHIVKPLPLTGKDQARAGSELGHRLSEVYQAFVWERGAGETMACGSGACAIGALALSTGLVEREDWIAVDMPGGRLYVRHEQEDGPVLLAGPGAFVYSGKLAL
jgi:diaminopimelate epimerase